MNMFTIVKPHENPAVVIALLFFIFIVPWIVATWGVWRAMHNSAANWSAWDALSLWLFFAGGSFVLPGVGWYITWVMSED